MNGRKTYGGTDQSAPLVVAYNAGEGKVERYQGVPPCLETRVSASLALIPLPWRVK